MWCAHCQADVATEVSPDNRRVRCATCSADLATSVSGHPAGVARDARELLARWSQSDLLDPFGPIAALKTRSDGDTKPAPPVPSPDSSDSTTKPSINTTAKRGDEAADVPKSAPASPTMRIEERPPSGTEVPRDENGSRDEKGEHSNVSGREERVKSAPRRHVSIPLRSPRRVDRPRAVQNRGPHFPVPRSSTSQGATKSTPVNAESLLGHLIAYLGVLGLTIGGILIVWSYFGGPESYAPTGWFITTIGQMLLFLGVITLVSKGLEQTTIEVTRRVEHLGEQLLRFEHALEDRGFHGPHIRPEQLARDEEAANDDVETNSVAPESARSRRPA